MANMAVLLFKSRKMGPFGGVRVALTEQDLFNKHALEHERSSAMPGSLNTFQDFGFDLLVNKQLIPCLKPILGLAEAIG